MGNGAETMFVTSARDERRGGDRRAPRRTFDPLFAATLVNQIAPREADAPAHYPSPRGPRAGIAFDERA